MNTSPLIKVCGITRAEDAAVCVELGVNLIGFIFHKPSPRNVLPEEVAAMETGGLTRVGVFVKQSVGEVLEIMDQARLDLAQLHGDQDEAFCVGVGPDRVMRVFWPQRCKDGLEFGQEIERFAPFCRFLLFDAGTSGGGHGQTLDFEMLKEVTATKPWLLAGGLGPENVEIALETCAPAGLDLNSGVESTPGVKDRKKIKDAVRIIRGDRNK
jgi:phosphoribosylanthranilate isomerase